MSLNNHKGLADLTKITTVHVNSLNVNSRRKMSFYSSILKLNNLLQGFRPGSGPSIRSSPIHVKDMTTSFLSHHQFYGLKYCTTIEHEKIAM